MTADLGPMRIHIADGPGAGKASHAHRLGDALRSTVHELDHIALKGPDYFSISRTERVAHVQAIGALRRM